MKGDIKNITILIIVFGFLLSPIWLSSELVNFFVQKDGKFNNSAAIQIIVAAMGSFAGAVGGAHAIRSYEKNKDLLAEFRACNASIIMAAEIFDSVTGLRNEHTNVQRNRYYESKGEYELYMINEVVGPFNLNLDKKNHQMASLQNDLLKNYIFEKLTLVGRPLVAIVRLNQTLENLSSKIKEKNIKISDWTSNPENPAKFISDYFGEPFGNELDLTYRDLIDTQHTLAETAQFLCKILVEDLRKHAKKVRRDLGKENLMICNFSIDQLAPDLLPNEIKFSSWNENFKAIL